MILLYMMQQLTAADIQGSNSNTRSVNTVTEKGQKSAAKAFAAFWKDKGYEKGEVWRCDIWGRGFASADVMA